MKMRFFRLLLFLILTLCLILGAASAADQKKSGELYGDLDGLFSWFYAADSLPAGASLRESGTHLTALYSKSSTAASPVMENITACSLDFLSGDEALKNAVVLTVEHKGTINPVTLADERYLSVDIRINNAALVSPGTAVFRLTLESSSFRCVKDCTLRVFSADEVPSVTPVGGTPQFHLRPGQSLAVSDLVSSLLSEDFKAYSLSNSLPVPYFGAFVSAVPEGMSSSAGQGTVSVLDFGLYPLELHYYVSNLEWVLPFEVEALSYSVSGPSFLLPGASARYRIIDEDAGASRRFTWAVSGNEAEINPQTGELQVSSSAVPGRPLALTITPESDPPLTTAVVIPAGAVGDMPELQIESEKGFQIPVPTSQTWEGVISSTREGGWVARCRTFGFENALVYVDSNVAKIPAGFREDPDAARSYYDQTSFSNNVTNLQQRDLEIDGHPARMITYTLLGDGQPTHFGEIHYVRNDYRLSFRIYTSKADTPADRVVPVSFNNLERFAAEIHYNEESAPIRQADTALSIAVKDDISVLVAGETYQFSAAFANPDSVRADGHSQITWSVTDTVTGTAPENVTISNTGLVTVRRALEAPAEVEITASSEAYGTSASLRVTAVPSAKQISIDPANDLIYLNDSPVTYRALTNPDTIPANLISWTLSGTAAEMTVTEDGAAVLTPVQQGKGTLTAIAPGGRRAELKISVLVPVESISLSRDKEAFPGGKVSYSASVEPNEAGNKKLTWSLDVPSDIAVISKDGKLTIQKSTPVGTQITVTCTAPGAPEPVVATDVLTVVSK